VVLLVVLFSGDQQTSVLSRTMPPDNRTRDIYPRRDSLFLVSGAIRVAKIKHVALRHAYSNFSYFHCQSLEPRPKNGDLKHQGFLTFSFCFPFLPSFNNRAPPSKNVNEYN